MNIELPAKSLNFSEPNLSSLLANATSFFPMSTYYSDALLGVNLSFRRHEKCQAPGELFAVLSKFLKSFIPHLMFFNCGRDEMQSL